MSSEPFNSQGGFSVGVPPVTVIDSSGNVVGNLNTSGDIVANNIYGTNYYYANGQPFSGSGNGIQGLQGIQGRQGIQGVQGFGSQGAQGVQGFGLQGLQGQQGLSGAYAAQGIQGTQGIQGRQGLQGVIGAQGIQGSQGLQGLQGLQGTQGVQGVQGVFGSQGTQGLTGAYAGQGIQGVQGVLGIQGVQGIDGLYAAQGIQGLQGLQGGGLALTVAQSNITGGNISNTVSNVTNLLFDTDTGFAVTDLGAGNVVVSLGSTFKTWEVNGQPSLVAVGEDTVEFIAGPGIEITTDPNATPQSITFSTTGGNGIANGTSNIQIPIANGNIVFSANGVANILTVAQTGVYIPNTVGGATNIMLGDPTLGNLISNAVSLSNSSSVSNAIAQLNNILGKLVPPAPPAFPAGQTLTISSLSTYRMANFTQTDNTPGANKSVAGGTTVTSVRRQNTYTTGNILTSGPGDQGTVTSFLNGTDAGNVTLTSSLAANGTYGNLIIFNNYDYNVANANITAGFWSVFSARASGNVTEGWNEVYIGDSATSNTNIPYWYYDSSSPGTPTFSSVTFTGPVGPSYTYSSTVPHYNNTNQFTLGFNVNKLSGNMYPTSDTFVTGTSGGAFAAPASVTYAGAGVTTPLAQFLYVASGSQAVTTTSNIIAGFGSSSGSPSVSVTNSYNVGTQTFNPAATVLYKTGTSSSMEETNITIGGPIGTGSGPAYRIINPGSTDTPVFSASAAAFNSESSTLQVYDATIVGAILKHDVTNYASGYLPIGPNLSAGRSGSQYFTFKFIRTSVSKFDFRWTGTLAGLWVAVPGSVIDSTSTLNGWIDMSQAYAGAGIPGSNVGAGGNGFNGCALGGVAPLNVLQTNKSVTATFGTVSSSSTVTSEIYVRVKLTTGQTITAFSLQPASN